jgi:bifunctional non-homologous end joining protein LigD
MTWPADLRQLRPMLATLAEHPLNDPAYVYEPKYDGIRALVSLDPARGIQLWSRLGNDKTSQFPEVVRALEPLRRRVRKPIFLDGEVVALDEHGEPAGFQQLQGRIHLTKGAGAGGASVAFIAFDVLREGDADLRDEPFTARRAALERLLRRHVGPVLRLSEVARGDGASLFEHARAQGWEGLIAKKADSCYRTGRRSPEWVKLKLVLAQEFVIGGWTEPRGARSYFGALLLGVYKDGALEYVGHTGAGFDEKELRKVFGLLKPLERGTCPFRARPRTNERPHWIEPRLVAEVKFTEWTSDGKLRHPTYLGLRDDVDPSSVRREPQTPLQRLAAERGRGSRAAARGSAASAPPAQGQTAAAPARVSGRSRPPTAAGPAGGASRARKTARQRGLKLSAPLQLVVDQLQQLEDSRRDGTLALPDGDRLEVSNLTKVFWPGLGITKGELLRYYVRVSPALLPVVADRPLVMKRYPNGVAGKAFYQQRAPDTVPAGVRVEVVENDGDVPSRLVGGSLKTLLYMTQLAALSQDPWFSRVQSPDMADHVAIDLDPMPGVPFETVVDVARWVRDELEKLKAPGFAKTSGADGLHIFIPLPPGTPYEAGVIYAQIVATIVAKRHPRQATIERTVRARGDTVYVDYLQNIRGKTLACAYSARASDYAGASTPLTWQEIDEGVDRRDFTIRTLPERLETVGDLWSGLFASKGARLEDVERYVRKVAR